ncbi:MAG TPA: HAD hydrolase-like protein [Patescibacteria group bacterium]|nr:HAD hydrolase-like protein [Patescibacteria group bacterium]
MIIEGVKGIVWDLDGTLIDSFGLFERVIAEVVAESGHKMPSHEFMLLNYHGSLQDTVQHILGIDSAAELDAVVTSFLSKQAKHYEGDMETHLFQDASMLAQRAAKEGIQQLLITNREHAGRGPASPRFIIAATVLADCIHEVFPGDEIEYKKPDKRSLGDWMERHKLAPHEVLVIGDQHLDAQLAINLGARAMLVQRNGEIPHLSTLTEPNYADITYVDNLEEVEFANN